MPKPARPKPKKRWWVKPAWIAGLTLLFLTVCVGAPTLAVWSLINLVMNKAKDFTDAHAQSEAEWNAITSFWPAPAADAAPETLLPPTFGDGRFRLRAADQAPPDAELGITLAGRRGIYDGPDGEVEVRFYRCSEDQAKAIHQKVYAAAQARLNDAAEADPGSKRTKAVYAQQDTGRRTVTFGFHDNLSQHQEYGKLWYGGGWTGGSSNGSVLGSMPAQPTDRARRRASEIQPAMAKDWTQAVGSNDPRGPTPMMPRSPVHDT